MKRITVFLLCIMWSAALLSQSAVKINDCGLSNFYMVDTGVYRSEQPGREQFRALERYGITEVLNLRYFHSDKCYVKGLGLTVHQVRMNAHDANDYDVARALDIIKNRKGRILIHCRHGSDRTGLIVAMYGIVFRNKTRSEAIDEMVRGGFGFHTVYDNIVRYIERVDVDRMKKHLGVR